MKQDTELYSMVFDIMNENMQAAGEEFPYSKDAFLYAAKRDLKTVDMLDLAQLDKKSYIQALYAGLLFGLPTEKKINSELAKEETELEYKKRLFKEVSSSMDALKKGAMVTNNIYGEPDLRIGKNQARVVPIELRYIDRLYNIYYRLPGPVKSLIKRALRRWGRKTG